MANWEIAYHQKNTDSGFSATLFRNKNTNEFVYAIRGSELFSNPDFGDWLTNVFDIGADGLAIKQIIDVYNDWQRLNTEIGVAYQVAVLQPLVLETSVNAALR